MDAETMEAIEKKKKKKFCAQNGCGNHGSYREMGGG